MNQHHVQHEVHDGHHHAQLHRRARVSRRAERAAQHEEDQHATRESEQDAQVGHRFGFHGRSGIHDIQQPRRREIPKRRHDAERDPDRREKRLVHDTVDLLRISGAGEAGHQHTHSREQR